jgi:hypothetical protein
VDESQPRERAEMLGDTFQEAAVLFLVFVPLDLALGLAEEQLFLSRNQVSLIVVGVIVASALLEWIGMRLEHWR